MAKRLEISSDEKAKILVDAVEDRKAVDPVLIDLRDKTLMTDFFLVCSGTSDVHIRAIAERVEEVADEQKLNRPRIEGQGVAEWVLLDFGDVVLHVMNAESRDRYKLETFWTTPQPKGALPPTPDNATAHRSGSGIGEDRTDADDRALAAKMLAETEGDDDEDDSDDELDELDFDDDDEAFFEEADTEVEPVDEPDDLEPDPATQKSHSLTNGVSGS